MTDPLVGPQEKATQSWAVTVERDGEPIVTIASNCLSGRDLSAEDERVIRMAAEHLRSFVGASPAVGQAPMKIERSNTPEARAFWDQCERAVAVGQAPKEETIADLVIDPSSEAGQLAIRNAAFLRPTTAGDPLPDSPDDVEAHPWKAVWQAPATDPESLQPVVDELRRRMKATHDYDLASKPALFEIGVMAMTAQSDPHASAAKYRQALIDICNLALKAQDDLRALAAPSVPPSETNR